MEPFYIIFMAVIHVFFWWPILFWREIVVLLLMFWLVNIFRMRMRRKQSNGNHQPPMDNAPKSLEPPEARLNKLYSDSEPQQSRLGKYGLILVVAVLCSSYFFAYVMPGWLPKAFDPYQKEIRQSLYVTPHGIFTDRGRFFWLQYGCGFLFAQQEAVRLKKIGSDDDFRRKSYLAETEASITSHLESYECLRD